MGIKGLGKFIGDFAPRAIKRQEAASFASRVVAIDASMSLYQFLVSIRETDTFGSFTNDAGECTSHIAGMLNRALRLLEQGIKPVYVFDGEPPALKAGELAKRRGTREAAATAAEAAREAGDAEELRKQIVRSLRVEKKHSADVQKLLRLMGLPVVQAPGEAEAQCAELTKQQRVWATATEDADALTFGATRLIRNLTFGTDRSSSSTSTSSCSNRSVGGTGSSSKITSTSSGGSHHRTGGSSSSSGGVTAAVLLIDLPTLLEELQFTQQQFVDFCILCGCDYCGSVRGVGAKTAYAIIRDHKSLEKAIDAGALEKEKLPDPFPFEEVRQLFINPRVLPAAQVNITWTDVDVDGLRTFLVQENQFNEQRVENCILRLKKARGKASQMRLESFFGTPTTKSSSLMQKQQQERQRQLELQRQKKCLPRKNTRKQKPDPSSSPKTSNNEGQGGARGAPAAGGGVVSGAAAKHEGGATTVATAAAIASTATAATAAADTAATATAGVGSTATAVTRSPSSCDDAAAVAVVGDDADAGATAPHSDGGGVGNAAEEKDGRPSKKEQQQETEEVQGLQKEELTKKEKEEAQQKEKEKKEEEKTMNQVEEDNRANKRIKLEDNSTATTVKASQ